MKISFVYVAAGAMLGRRLRGMRTGLVHGLIRCQVRGSGPWSGRFTVATFNIHSGKGTDGRVNLGRTADLLNGVDWRGSNEVAGAGWDRRIRRAYRRETQDSCGLIRQRDSWARPTFGSAAPSRLPVESWLRIP